MTVAEPPQVSGQNNNNNNEAELVALAQKQEENQYLGDVARMEQRLLQKQNLLKEHKNDAYTSMLHLLGADAMSNVTRESLHFIDHVTQTILRQKKKLSAMATAEKFDSRNYLPTFLCSNPAQSSASTGSSKFIASVFVSYKGHSFKKSVNGDLNQSADDFITSLLSKVKMQGSVFDEHISLYATDWVLKAQGSAQYLYGANVSMKQFEYVTNAMNKGVRIVDFMLMDRDYAIEKRASQLVDVELKDVDLIDGMVAMTTTTTTTAITTTATTINKNRKNSSSSSSNGVMNGHVEEKGVVETGEENEMDVEGGVFDHTKLTIDHQYPIEMKYISMWDLKRALRIKIRSLPGINFSDVAPLLTDSNETNQIYVTADLIHGALSLQRRLRTKSVSFSSSEVCPVFNQYLVFKDIHICELPKETVLQLSVFIEQKKSTVLYAQLRVPVVDYRNVMKSGSITSKMWKISLLDGDELRSVSTAVNEATCACSILFDFDNYVRPVVFPTVCSGPIPKYFDVTYDEYEKRMRKIVPSCDTADLQKLIETDTLYELSPHEKFMIWNARDQLINNPKALPKFLSSVPYKYPKARMIADEYLDKWKEPTVYDCFELLDYSYAHTKVREYAVRKLNTLPDDTLNDFLIQICQCMKTEVYHDSPLSRFLLERSFKSPHRIGHSTFWCLKSELHVAPLQERLTTVLKAYLNNVPKHCQQLLKQTDFVDKLLSVAITIKKYSTKVEQQEVMQEKLKELEHETCLVPLNPRMEVQGITVSKCMVMGSKKRPLFLFLKNADAGKDIEVPDVLVIFKAGDDIRQDTLTLQILKIMDFVWKQDPELGDLFLNPYGCVSTGDMCGFIEVVTRSATIASVTKKYGGASAALKKTPMYQWLKEKNDEKSMPAVVERFVKSCAAYCVFTYALGIGDRHNDNIMLQETGELLHIDFGHFLGNIKTFAGVKRESAPFVFTKAYNHVICADNEKHDSTKSNNFATFQKLCFKSFQALRTNGNLFMVLLKLMCNSGIPELRTPSDILYLRNTLVPQITKEELVYKYMCDLITSSVNDKRTKFNEFWHIFANEHIIK